MLDWNRLLIAILLPSFVAVVFYLQITGILAAVDSTVESSISTQYGVKGFPTLKYFK